MSNTVITVSRWRDSGREAKLWVFNASATFPILLMLFNIRYWTFMFALGTVVVLQIIDHFGFTLPVFARFLRSKIAGRRKIAKPWWV